MSTKIPVGEKIRLARTAQKLTVCQFGEKIGLSYAWVSLVENGQIAIKLDQYEQIQAALGYRFDTPEAEAAFAFFLKTHNGDPP